MGLASVNFFGDRKKSLGKWIHRSVVSVSTIKKWVGVGTFFLKFESSAVVKNTWIANWSFHYLYIQKFWILSGGPIMPAILDVIWTKYAFNLGYKGDQLGLQSWLWWGLNMPAILVQKGTKYACNVSYVRDHICLQSYLIGIQYACNVLKL